MPIGMPGWPELAAWTASMARKRMALARSRRLGVVMGGKSREAAPGDSRVAHCPTPPRGSKNVGRGYVPDARDRRSEEHTSELQSLMRISYAVFCLKKTK